MIWPAHKQTAEYGERGREQEQDQEQDKLQRSVMSVEGQPQLFFISGGATSPRVKNRIIVHPFVAPPEIKSKENPSSTDMTLRWSLRILPDRHQTHAPVAIRRCGGFWRGLRFGGL